jgi:sirohydrochlorin cobaltochelatase
VARTSPDWRIEVCFIEHAEVLLDEGLDRAARGARQVLVIPFILNAAGHVKMELPAAMKRARARHPDRSSFPSPASRHGARDLRRPAGQLDRLMKQLAMPDPQTTGVILLGRGSSDAGANGELAKVARWMFEANEHELVDLAFTGVTWPRLETVVQRQARLGMTQICIVPVYLFTGVLIERIKAQVERLRGNIRRSPLPGQLLRLRQGHFRPARRQGRRPRVARRRHARMRRLQVPRTAEAEHLHDHSHTPGRSLRHAPVHAHAHAWSTPIINTTTNPPTSDHAMTAANTITEQLTAAGRAIEHDSFAIIDAEVGPHAYTRRAVAAGAPHDPRQCRLRVQRPDRLSPAGHAAGWLPSCKGGTPIVADVEMICVGLSAPRLQHFGMTTQHYISDADVIERARAEGTTRAVQAMRKAHREGLLDGAIVGIGNAPTALIEVVRLIREEGVRPALVIGMPVGFVSAAESKDLLMHLDEVPRGSPSSGRKGGSTLVVAAIHALLGLAERRSAPHERQRAGARSEKVRKGDTRRERGNRTGSPPAPAAAAAARAATLGLLTGVVPDSVVCRLPNGQ